MGAKSEASHAANYVARKIKKHVFRKGVWRMCDQGPPGREGAPLMVSGSFAVALSRAGLAGGSLRFSFEGAPMACGIYAPE